MLKYYNTMIAMQEIPDEVSLAINITGCPRHCDGCHSPHLWKNSGLPLVQSLNDILIYRPYITCVLLMGGDWDIMSLMDFAESVKVAAPELKIGLYTALELDEVRNFLKDFDYVKTGPYIKELGGLDNPDTNQVLYRIIKPAATKDKPGTYRFEKIDMIKKEV